jgi:hypothetical protein
MKNVKQCTVFELDICTSLTAQLQLYSFVSDIPEDDLWRSKHVAEAQQNNKRLFMFKCAICWIK